MGQWLSYGSPLDSIATYLQGAAANQFTRLGRTTSQDPLNTYQSSNPQSCLTEALGGCLIRLVSIGRLLIDIFSVAFHRLEIEEVLVYCWKW